MSPTTASRMRVLGYGRLSFDDPDRKTSSVADQESGARRYAERQGWQIAHFHSDEGITGATMERPGLQALLAAVRARAVDTVIIEDVDRLGRDQEHLQYMAKLFRAYAVKLHAVAIGPVEDLVLAVKGLVAEEQRRRIAYTTRRGLVGKARRGGATGGKTLGYERVVIGIGADGGELDRYVPIEAEAATVLRAFELYASGHSLKAICALFDAEGVPPRAPTRSAATKPVRGTPRRSAAMSRAARASSTTAPISASGCSTGAPGSRCRPRHAASSGSRA